MDKPDFDVLEALRFQRTHLKNKISRLNRLIETIDKTVLKQKGER
jgi:hypothetical protein